MKIEQVQLSWNEDLPVFLSGDYLRATGEHFGWLGGFRDGELRWVIPFTRKRRFGFGLVQFQFHGICLGKDPVPTEEKEFLESALSFLKANGHDFVLQSPAYGFFTACPDRAVAIPFGTYYLDLAPDEKDLWAGLHTNHRKNVKQALKKGVMVSTGREHLPAVYDLIAGTLGSGNLHIPTFEDLDRKLEHLGSHAEVFTAFGTDGKAEGCVISFFSRPCAYGIYSAGKATYPFWKAILYFRERGVKRFDFVGARVNPDEGSKIAGIQRFKSGFGSDMETGYIWKAYLSPRAHALKLAKYLYGPDIIDQELGRKAPGP
ncbi:MAG TPA: hypothetical protein VMB35_07305 [Methanomicrobiales archaeon]|nr:hypothetical protein [Methanomicrobiales archaeon]